MEDNKQVKQRFFKDLETGKSFMEPIHQKMDLYYEIYRNRWAQQDGVKVSDLYTYVETIVPILTNNRVRGTVKAEYPDYVKHAEGMGYILDYVYDTNNWDYKAQRIARMAEIYRAALAYTGYDPEANNQTGKLTITEINSRWCYIDPSVTDLEDSSFFIYIEPMRVTKAIKLYPDKASEIKNRKSEGSYSVNGQKESWFKSLFKSVANSLSYFTNGVMTRHGEAILPELDEAEKRKNAIAFVHYWYRDEDTDEWRVAYFADDVLLEDTENPFHHGKLPYDIYCPTEDILSAVGIPMAEHIENLNHEKNVLLSTIVKHGKKVVKPPRMYNTAVGIRDTNALKGNDDDLIPVANPDFIPLNAIVADLHPAPMPNFFNELPERFDSISDRLTGVNDSFRGMAQATSGKEVQLKQEASYTRIKTKVDNFEKFVKSISEKIIVNAMQFLNTSTAFRVKGDYTQFENINKDETPFEVEPIQQGMNELGEPVFDKQEFFLYANPNEWTKIEQPEEELAEGEEPSEESTEEEEPKEAFRILQMVVDIEAGSSLPTSPMARKEEALELYNSKAIDQIALLEAYDYPKRDEIIKRMQEQQMMMQQAEMQAQMPQQPMPQGQPMQSTDDVGMSLDYIRQASPELQAMGDEELMEFLANMQANGGM